MTTALLVIGLVVALVGVGIALQARLAGRPAMVGVPDTTHVDDVGEALQRVDQMFQATDEGLRTGIIVAVVGLALAGVGAYLGSDARALGADVGGSGTSETVGAGSSW